MAKYVNSKGEVKDFTDQNKPIGKAPDGRTIYADGSKGWSSWEPYTLIGPAKPTNLASTTPQPKTAAPIAPAPVAGYNPNWRDEFLKKGIDENSPEGKRMQELERAAKGQSADTNKTPLQQVNELIQNTFQNLQNEVTKRFGEYRAGKPFNVDEVLAEKTKEAGEQIDPYYNEVLGDYLLGVQRKLDRGANDTKDLLTELNTSVDNYTGNVLTSLTKAVDTANQGFADSGLFGSGSSLKAEGELKTGSGNILTDYTRKADNQKKQLLTGLDRNVEDINSTKKGFVTDLERNRFTDITGRASQLTKEAGQQYTQGFQASLPTELQSASGFDMLKSLGIYS